MKPVQNQGQCGSCWGLTTTGYLEGGWFLATGNLLPLSEQQLVNCDTVDSGCTGELMNNDFASAEENAVCTETVYSYTATKVTCMVSSPTTGITQGSVTGYKDVFTDSAGFDVDSDAATRAHRQPRETSPRFNRTRLVC